MQPPLNAPVLTGTVEAEVCIVGGGIAGVSCAHELSSAGLTVALIEADEIAWGASGRNGGLVLPGFAATMREIERRAGALAAKALFNLSVEGMQIFRENVTRYGLQGVDIVPGLFLVSRYRNADGAANAVRHAERFYNYRKSYLPTAQLREQIKSDRYFDGIYDPQSFHAHSLNYCLGMARVAQGNGVEIFERTRAKSMTSPSNEHIIETEHGRIRCKHVVLCVGGHVDHFNQKLKSTILRVGTFVAVTEELGSRTSDILNTRAAIVDTRLSCDYFRVTKDNRLLWGAGMSGYARQPKDLSERLKRGFASVFPQLQDVRVEASWIGWTGYTRHRMPYIREISHGVWAATALGGHGLNVGPLFGRLMSEAIVDGGKRHRAFDAFGMTWNGGVFGPAAAECICRHSELKERVREWRSARQ